MKDNVCTVRCDRCKTATIEIAFNWQQDWQELNEKLLALGWRVDGDDVCPDCAKKGSDQ